MEKELHEIRKSIIDYDLHFIKRWKTRDIELDKVDETIRTGRAVKQNGRKIIFERYFGKENETYCIVCIARDNFTEVRTVWKKEGR
ncbi:MAG: hypothetical protein NT001_06910 [Candidatus Woesearchaeota archaeon]|nr:hypothetical protein [Candidatus Woesearchaeota archaeon]